MKCLKLVFAFVTISLLLLPQGIIMVVIASGESDYDHRLDFDYTRYRGAYLAESPGLPASYPRTTEPHNGYSALDRDHDRIHDALQEPIVTGSDISVQLVDVIMVYEREPDEADIEALSEFHHSALNVYPTFNAIMVNDVSVLDLRALAELPNVLMVEKKGMVKFYSDVATPAVKARESAEYSPNTAWELGYTGAGVSLGIMDTGIDSGHPSLTGKWLGGVDFTKPDTILTPRDGSYDADDTHGHGTTCAGIATGTGAPEGKYMGTAPDTRLVEIRIGSTIGYAPGELLQDWYDAALKATDWAIQHKDDRWQGAGEEYRGIELLSLSWGVDVGGSSDGSDIYSAALEKAVEAGIIVVVAAGNAGPNNDGFDGMGSASGVITIGATDDLNTVSRDDDIIADYSSRGPRKDNNDGYPYDELKPDVSAPGTNIIQAQFERFGDGSGSGYGNRGSGTSYATPNVAGVVALMREANPVLDQVLIKEILRFTAERRGEPTVPDLDPFWNRDFGWGIIDAYRAVKMAEELNDVSAIDVELQCHVLNMTDSAFDPDASKAVATGLAWARVGKIERLEYRIDNESIWHKIRISEDAGAGEYLNWSYSLDMQSLSKGNHVLHTRAVGSDGRCSFVFSQQFYVGTIPAGFGAGISGGIGVFAAVVLVIIIGVAIWSYRKKRKK